jgi:phosphate transport system substrate-binding protein
MTKMTDHLNDHPIVTASSTSDSHPQVQSQVQTCPRCGYDANPAAAPYCEVCGAVLNNANHCRVVRQRRYPQWLGLQWLGLQWLGLQRPGSQWLKVGSLVVLVAAGSWGISQHWPDLSTRLRASLFQSDRQPSRLSIQRYARLQDVPNVPPGIFNYGNAHAFAALDAQGMHQAISQAHPRFQLRYTEPINAAPGSTTAISMLINGELSIAQSVRPLEDSEMSRASQRKFSLEQVPIGIDGVAVYGHSQLAVTQISLAQLQAIYLGKLTNWRDLGGEDLPIIPFIPDPQTTSIAKLLLGDRLPELRPDVEVIRDHTTGIRKIAQTPGAICLGSAQLVLNQKMVHFLSLSKDDSQPFVSLLTETGQINEQALRDESYPMTRRLFVMIRRDGSPEEAAGVAYANLLLSEEGQQILEQAGFVPIF